MWQEELKKIRGETILLLGIGNRWRMDDAIGLEIAGQLHKDLKAAPNSKQLTLFMGGTTPEDCLPELMAVRPGVVVMVDACN